MIRYLLGKIPFDGAQIPNFGQLLMIKLKGSQKHQTNVHFCTGKSRFSFIYAEGILEGFFGEGRDKEFIGLMEEIKKLIAPQQIGTNIERTTETFFALLCIHFYF